MEENKIDPFQIIGFVILMAGLFWWIYTLPDIETKNGDNQSCLLYTSPSPRDRTRSRMPSSA